MPNMVKIGLGGVGGDNTQFVTSLVLPLFLQRVSIASAYADALY